MILTNNGAAQVNIASIVSSGDYAINVLPTGNVNASLFGLLASYAVGGQVYAQPLYVAGVKISGQGTQAREQQALSGSPDSSYLHIKQSRPIQFSPLEYLLDDANMRSAIKSVICHR